MTGKGIRAFVVKIMIAIMLVNTVCSPVFAATQNQSEVQVPSSYDVYDGNYSSNAGHQMDSADGTDQSEYVPEGENEAASDEENDAESEIRGSETDSGQERKAEAPGNIADADAAPERSGAGMQGEEPEVSTGFFDIYVLAAQNSNEYTVTFVTYDGDENSPGSQIVPEGGCAADPGYTSQRTGYMFGGWYRDQAGTQSYDFSEQVCSDITLYARWLTLYTVRFEANEGRLSSSGAAPAVQHIPSGEKAEDPGEMVRTAGVKHNDFIGWFTDRSYVHLYDFDTPVTQDITLYAGWGDIYTVMYDPGDHGKSYETSGVDGKPIEKVAILYVCAEGETEPNHKYPDRTTGEYTRPVYRILFPGTGGLQENQIDFRADEGYVFKGWDLVGLKYNKDKPETFLNFQHFEYYQQHGFVFVAEWEEKSGYQVTYKAGDHGIGQDYQDPTEYAYGQKITVRTLAETTIKAESGYSFAGWKDEAGHDVAETSELTMTGDRELTAKWSRDKYRLKYKMGDHGIGQDYQDSTEYAYGQKITVRTLAETTIKAESGYSFAGWKDEAGHDVAESSELTMTGDRELTAKWSRDKYRLKYKMGDHGIGQDYQDPTEYAYGQKITVRTLAETTIKAESGYSFAGWKDEAGHDVAETSELTITADTELTAFWNKNVSYRVLHFRQNPDGTWNDTPDEEELVQNVEENTLVRGVRRLYDRMEYDVEKSRDTSEGYTRADDGLILKLYYRYTYYTVTFDSMQGSYVPVQKILQGNCAIYPTDPTRDKCEFAGWYTESAYVTLYDFTTPVNADITLYAKWSGGSGEGNGDNGDGGGGSGGGDGGSGGDGSSLKYYLYIYDDPSHGGEISNAIWTCIDEQNHIWRYGYDNTYAANGWVRAENPYSGQPDKIEWFHFNEKGHMTFGWVKHNENIWYYTDQFSNGDLGALVYGWYFEKQDMRWYYLQPETGIMSFNWNEIDSESYYFANRIDAKQVNWFIDYDRAGSQELNGIWFYSTTNPHCYGSMYFDDLTPDMHTVAGDGSLTVPDSDNRYMTSADYMLLFDRTN